MGWETAFEPFARAYDDPNARGADGRRVGCIGADIPFELVEACGWTPVRLAGLPGSAAPSGDQFVGGGGDADVRSMFQLLVDGGYGPLDRLIIAHDSEALARLYYALREFQQRWPDRAAALPVLWFFDLLHLPRATTQAYNRRRLEQMRSWLGGCDDERLSDAIAARNAVRWRLHALREHRRSGRVSGTEALKILGSAWRLRPAELGPLLDTLLGAAAARGRRTGIRLFLTGSAHDHALAYAAIEASGMIIVGEDHDWGDRGNEALVAETGDPLDALETRYRAGTPAAAKFSIADRAAYTAARVREAQAEMVLCLVRKGDPAPRWDVPDQRAAVAPIPFMLLDDQPYATDAKALAQELNRVLREETVA